MKRTERYARLSSKINIIYRRVAALPRGNTPAKKIPLPHHLTILTALALLSNACFDDIRLDLPKSEQKMVVEGYVQQSDEFFHAYFLAGVNAAVNDQGGAVKPVPVAQAYLIYNDVAFPQYPLFNNQPARFPRRFFERQAPGTGSPTLRLRVELLDGRIYESGSEPILPVPQPQDVALNAYTKEIVNSLGNIVEQNFMEIKITTPLRAGTGEKSFLKWDMDGVYRFIEAPPPPDNPFEPQNTCYLPHRIGNGQILIFNGRETTEETLERYPFIKDVLINHYFSSGYYLTIYQQSLSAGAFRYWEQLRQNAVRGGGLFEPTPGAVQGNIQNVNDLEEPVLGYFYASEVDTIRHLIKAGDVGRPGLYCYQEANMETDRCMDCTIIQSSTLQKPDYWIE